MFDYATLYWTLADNAHWIVPAGVGARIALAIVPSRPLSPPPGVCLSPPPLYGFSPDEQRKVETAWALAETCPNAHMLGSVKQISKGNAPVGGTCSGGNVTIDEYTTESPRSIATCIMHEAAHAFHGEQGSPPENEKVAFREENIARRYLGLSQVSESFDRHIALGLNPDGTIRPGSKLDGAWGLTSPRQQTNALVQRPVQKHGTVSDGGFMESHDVYRRRMKQEKLAQSHTPADAQPKRAPTAEQPKTDVPWPGWESHDAYRRRMHAEKLKKWGLA